MNAKVTWKPLLATIALVACASTTGCQSYIGGQTLPSPYWLTDDVQYHAPGAEFKLSNEAAAMRAFEAERAAQRFGAQ